MRKITESVSGNYVVVKLTETEKALNNILGTFVVIDTFYEKKPSLKNLCYVGTSAHDAEQWVVEHD